MTHATRRQALIGFGSVCYFGMRSQAQAAPSASPRLVVINMTGGVDGLSIVAPYGDPYLAKLRAPIMDTAVGTTGGMFDLGGFYGLHPSMPHFRSLFVNGQALAVHAVGNVAYTRSHFDGQDILQAGSTTLRDNGWLNRVASLIPGTGAMQSSMAMSPTVPLLLQGAAPVAGWMPGLLGGIPSATLAAATAQIARDPVLGPAMAVALGDYNTVCAIRTQGGNAPAGLGPVASVAHYAAIALAAPSGPSIASFESGNVDTHGNQMSTLKSSLTDLDNAFDVLRTTLGAAWSSTVVVTITEFGRKAASNASGGTDHGTGFAMLLAGGAVAGGRVVATWPGLSPNALYQGQDLQPTVDVRSVLTGILTQHMRLPMSAMATIFPAAGGISPLRGLVTA